MSKPESKGAFLRNRYMERKRTGACVDCGITIKGKSGFTRCVECGIINKERRAKRGVAMKSFLGNLI